MALEAFLCPQLQSALKEKKENKKPISLNGDSNFTPSYLCISFI